MVPSSHAIKKIATAASLVKSIHNREAIEQGGESGITSTKSGLCFYNSSVIYDGEDLAEHRLKEQCPQLAEALAEKIRPLEYQIARIELYCVAQTVVRAAYWRARLFAQSLAAGILPPQSFDPTSTPSTKNEIPPTPSTTTPNAYGTLGTTKEWVWLERQIRNKKLADGTIATFPRLVDGVHRNLNEPGHWYWFLAWGDGKKKRRYIPQHQVYLMRSLLGAGKPIESILLHLSGKRGAV